ncbi:hypothetical protein ACWF94_10195 [Streptomyces sp. NPDC055078]
MRLGIQDTYLGFRELVHDQGCRRPAWTVDIREDDAYRTTYTGATERHSCRNEDCDHSDIYPRTTVRVICLSCRIAYVISGEGADCRHTTTRTTGIGQTPRKVAGVFLWPGEPWLDEEPRDWLVTREKPVRVRTMDVIGEIHERRGPRGGKQFTAAALPSPSGPYGIGTVRWERVQEGFTSVSAATKWIVAQAPDGGEAT